MPLYKRGTCGSSVVVSSSVYACNDCGHTEILRDASSKEKKCPKCSSMMQLISSQAEMPRSTVELTADACDEKETDAEDIKAS